MISIVFTISCSHLKPLGNNLCKTTFTKNLFDSFSLQRSCAIQFLFFSKKLKSMSSKNFLLDTFVYLFIDYSNTRIIYKPSNGLRTSQSSKRPEAFRSIKLLQYFSFLHLYLNLIQYSITLFWDVNQYIGVC